MSRLFFFFNDTATTEIYTLSLHDALPISDEELLQAAGGAALHLREPGAQVRRPHRRPRRPRPRAGAARRDRKSTRLNSSHGYISYAVFCLKKKKLHNHSARTPHPYTAGHV